jgi:hypothetical protein
MQTNELTMTTVIPVQGTFDIAQGRNTLRTKIAMQHWPVTFAFYARATTTLTALGEIILLLDKSRTMCIELKFFGQEPRCGIQLACKVSPMAQTASQWEQKVANLARAADELNIYESADHIEIQAYIWL